MKIRKYKVDEWVLYNAMAERADNNQHSFKAVVLNIRPVEDYYDYEIYIEEMKKFKKVREEHLFSLKQI
tara:strand:- start:1984 stop:2190 length:207 start_codon:yes stop_codon:yes gene_type:complete